MRPGWSFTSAPEFLLVAAGAVVVAACSAQTSDPTPATTDAARPNIIVVMVDDLRWDEFGAAGHPFVQTPNIDRIADEGVMFRNAFATTPICSPSRASFLTGQYVHTNGIIDNTDRSARSHEMPTFPQALQRAGYDTAFVGKWHMGNDHSPRPGFDYWVAMPGQGEAIDPELDENGTLTRVEGYVTDLITDRAIGFIERERDNPFFLFLAHKALHPNIRQLGDGSTAALSRSGFIPAERHEGMYADAEVPWRPNAYIVPTDKPALMRPLEGVAPIGPESGTPDRTLIGRLEMLTATDDSLGRILEALEAMGELDNTMIVFTSDHGYFNAEHGLSGERRLAYEETIRIPMLVRYPPLAAAGTTRDEMVLIIDLAATFLDLAGAAPDDALHGASLVPVLDGSVTNWRDAFLVEYFSDTVFRRIRNMGYQAVRTDRYKYIHYLELEGMDELYDLEADPYELDNIIDDPAAAATLAMMQDELAAVLQQSGEPDSPHSR